MTDARGEILAAIRQAHHLRAVPLPPALETVVERIAAAIAPLGDDRSVAEDVECARDLIRAGTLLDAPGTGVRRPTSSRAERTLSRLRDLPLDQPG